MYKVGKVIGKGAYGNVNIALHKMTSKFVAIKSFDKAKIQDASEKQKLKSEIEAMKTLRRS